MLDVHVGKRIRKLRELRNFSRENFAEKINISTKFLYEIETGKKGFSADILCRMSRVLRVSCDYIMFGEETAYRSPEKIICACETLRPAQIRKIQDILQLLYEMCTVV